MSKLWGTHLRRNLERRSNTQISVSLFISRTNMLRAGVINKSVGKVLETWPCRCGKRCRGSGLCPSAGGFSAAAPPPRCTVGISSSVSLLSFFPPGSSRHHCHLHHLHHRRPHRHPHRLIGPAHWESTGTEDSSKMTLRLDKWKGIEDDDDDEMIPS